MLNTYAGMMINAIIMIPIDAKTIFCMRLKAARKMAGISQKNLGIKAGLDEFVASTRINRYELGVYMKWILVWLREWKKYSMYR